MKLSQRALIQISCKFWFMKEISRSLCVRLCSWTKTQRRTLKRQLFAVFFPQHLYFHRSGFMHEPCACCFCLLLCHLTTSVHVHSDCQETKRIGLVRNRGILWHYSRLMHKILLKHLPWSFKLHLKSCSYYGFIFFFYWSFKGVIFFK